MNVQPQTLVSEVKKKIFELRPNLGNNWEELDLYQITDGGISTISNDTTLEFNEVKEGDTLMVVNENLDDDD